MTGTDYRDPNNPYDPTGQSAEMTLSKEVLRLGTEWTVSGSIRLRRRIVTETRTVQVTLRREELEIVVDHIDHDRNGTLAGTCKDGPVTDSPFQKPPLVIVLQQEEPEMVVRLTPYERVTVTTALAAGTGRVNADLRHEELQLDTTTPPTRQPRHESHDQ